MNKEFRFVIAGGGTGGHVFPALNIARALMKKGPAEILFFGTEKGLENKKVPQAGFKLSLIPVAGFQRRLTFKNLLFPFKLWKSIKISGRILKDFKPHLVIGTGGYVMGPVLKSAARLKIPFVIQEQNSYPGVTTRLMAARAETVFLAYKEARKYLSGAKKTLVCGNPIKVVEKNDKGSARKELGLNPDKRTILVFGGSQGAASLNNAVLQMINGDVIPVDYQLLWQTGAAQYDLYKDKIVKDKNIIMLPFIDDMDKAYAAADFAICRSGAMTVSELMSVGLPAILVPYPFAAADHQYKNAEAVVKHNAAIVIKDDEKLKENLTEAVKRLINNNDLQNEMSGNMAGLHNPDTIKIIINEIENILI